MSPRLHLTETDGVAFLVIDPDPSAPGDDPGRDDPSTAPVDLAAEVGAFVEDALTRCERVEAHVLVEDRAGQLALHRAGLRREGRRRGARSGPRGRRDDYVYARLRDDEVGTRAGRNAFLDSLLPTKRLISHVVIRDGEGRVLLCETTYKPEWELPGGVVEPAESPRAGAVRECREELGVDLEIPATPALVDWMPPWLGWSDALELIYDLGTLDAGLCSALSPDHREIAALHWVAPADLGGVVSELSARRLALVLAGGPTLATEDGTVPGPTR